MQPQLVGDHRDKLRIGGLAPGVADGVPEIGGEHLHISPVPCHLNGVTDCPLHSGGGGPEFFGDCGIKLLGDRVDDFAVLYRQLDGFP